MTDKTLFDPTYRYMDDIAEATFQGGAFDVTVRKSMHESGQMLSYSVIFRGLGGENMGVDEAGIAIIIQNVK